MANKLNVENLRKTQLKTLRNFHANLCEKKFQNQFLCKKIIFSPTFPKFLTILSTIFPPLLKPKLFHYSTPPTITTTYFI